MSLTDNQRRRLKQLLSKPQWPDVARHARLMLEHDRRRHAGRAVRPGDRQPVVHDDDDGSPLKHAATGALGGLLLLLAIYLWSLCP